jgi:hypothetical protein
MPSCRSVVDSELNVIFLWSVRSPASRWMSDFMCDTMSLMQRKKSTGLRTVPCCTPKVTRVHDDCEAFSTTRWRRFERNELIRVSVVPFINYYHLTQYSLKVNYEELIQKLNAVEYCYICSNPRVQRFGSVSNGPDQLSFTRVMGSKSMLVRCENVIFTNKPRNI